jgi:hypothetical protein
MKLKFDKHADLYPVPHGFQLNGGTMIRDCNGSQYLVLDQRDTYYHGLEGYVIRLHTGEFVDLSDLIYPIFVEPRL